MRTIHLLVILLALTARNAAAAAVRISTKDRLTGKFSLLYKRLFVHTHSSNFRRQLLLTPQSELGSSDAKKVVRAVKRARLSWEAKVWKIDPQDENI